MLEGISGDVRCLRNAMEEKNDRSTAGGVIVQSNGIIVHRLSTMSDSLPGMVKNLKSHRENLRSSLFQKCGLESRVVSALPLCLYVPHGSRTCQLRESCTPTPERDNLAMSERTKTRFSAHVYLIYPGFAGSSETMKSCRPIIRFPWSLLRGNVNSGGVF